MPQGDKSRYTDKLVRKAEHIADSYEAHGVHEREAEARAWATVNKSDGGGKNPGGSGRLRSTSHPAVYMGGKAAAAHTSDQRSASAKRTAETRMRNAARA